MVESAEGLRDTETTSLWLSTEHTEFVFHAPTKSDLLREQWHDETLASASYTKTLFPDLAGERVRSSPARSGSRDPHEIAAERLADLLAEAIAGP